MPEEVKVLTDAEILAQVAGRVLGWAGPGDWELGWSLIGLVVEAMRGKGLWLRLTQRADNYWCAEFHNGPDGEPEVHEYAVDPTAPRAVLLAALKAREGKDDQPI